MPALTHSPAHIIQALLIAEGLGITHSSPGDWKTYRHNIETTADQAIFVIGTTGLLDGREMRGGKVSRHHGLQIKVRALDGERASLKCLQIQSHLTEQVLRTTVAIDDATYMVHSISMTSDMAFLGQEEKNRRQVFSSNYTATIEEV